MEIERFLEALSSDRPTPGGGSASAMAGALSASLVAMVAGLSCKGRGIQTREMREIRRKARAIRLKLTRAIEEDAGSYEAVLKAFRLSKEGEKERRYRSRRIQAAYQGATVTPQKVCELSLRLLEFSKILLARGNRNAFSDTGVAAYLADTAMGGGLLNVRINLGSIRDEKFRKGKEKMISDLSRKRDRLISAIQKAIQQSFLS